MARQGPKIVACCTQMGKRGPKMVKIQNIQKVPLATVSREKLLFLWILSKLHFKMLMPWSTSTWSRLTLSTSTKSRSPWLTSTRSTSPWLRLQGGYDVVTKRLWDGYGVVMGWSWGGFLTVMWWLRCVYRVVTRWLCGGYGLVTGWSWGGYVMVKG